MKFLTTARFLLVTTRKMSKIINTSHYQMDHVPNVSIPEFLFKDISKYEHMPAMTCTATTRMYRYKDIKTLTNKLYSAFRNKVGLEAGQVVGLILPNSPEFPSIVLGALQDGLRVTFINPIFTAEEISKQFINAEVKCIIAMDDNKSLVAQVVTKLKDYRGTIYMDNDGNMEFGGCPLFDGVEIEIEKPMIDPHDIAVLPYSSGTTGAPKGVMLTHHNCVTNLVQIDDPQLLENNPTTDDFQERTLNVIPFYHIYGYNGIMNFCLHKKYHMISLPKFTPQDYIDALRKYKPTLLFTVPSLLLFLATHPDVKSEDLQSVKKVTTGAAPATRQLLDKFKTKAQRDDIMITQGYGLSETSPVVLLTPYSMPSCKTGSSGVLIPSTKARIVSMETGEDLPSNQAGELWIKGPQVMKGYLKNEDATSKTIDEEGWMHTGDVVYYDDDGYFYIVDRCKELIKCKGNQVSPTELEGLIMELDEVADVAVVGIPDEKCGEVPRAFVVLKENRKLLEKEIEHFLSKKVAPYKRLLGGVKFIDLVPRNHAGKIIRQQLKLMV